MKPTIIHIQNSKLELRALPWQRSNKSVLARSRFFWVLIEFGLVLIPATRLQVSNFLLELELGWIPRTSSMLEQDLEADCETSLLQEFKCEPEHGFSLSLQMFWTQVVLFLKRSTGSCNFESGGHIWFGCGTMYSLCTGVEHNSVSGTGPGVPNEIRLEASLQNGWTKVLGYEQPWWDRSSCHYNQLRSQNLHVTGYQLSFVSSVPVDSSS